MRRLPVTATSALCAQQKTTRGSAAAFPRGERWHRSALWLLPLPAVYFPCTGGTPVWSGVSCANGRVTALDFSSLDLVVYPSLSMDFPVAVTQLQQLADLGLEAPYFNGQLPAQWSSMTSLQRLSLAGSALAG